VSINLVGKNSGRKNDRRLDTDTIEFQDIAAAVFETFDNGRSWPIIGRGSRRPSAVI